MISNKVLAKILIILSMMILIIYTEGLAETDLSFPAITETDCKWDTKGNLLSETAHDLNGTPAVNSRGFHRAAYTWDEHGNLLSEKYFGLNGEPVICDKGYASAEYTYYTDYENKSYILTEDRYAADGSRADIPGEYSYRRDQWDNNQIIYTKFFNSKGELTRPSGGYAQILYEVEKTDEGTVITKRYLDADGSPLIGTEGGEVVISVYTPRLFLTKDITREYLDWNMSHFSCHKKY